MKILAPLTCFVLMAFTSSASRAADVKDLDYKSLLKEVSATAKRDPVCLKSKEGLPRRVLITRNTGLFEDAKGKSRKMDLAINQRLYLFGERGDFFEVGFDPYNRSKTGWVPKGFCLIWDHNEMLFLDEKSVPDETTRIHFWKTAEEAREGDPEKAIYSERIRRKGPIGDVFFPVIETASSGTLFKVGFVLGGEGAKDASGQDVSPEQRKQRVENISVVNIMLVIDATGSMAPYINEAKKKATEIVDSLESLVLKDLPQTSAEQKRIDLTVNFGLVAYRDKGDDFETRLFVPLTNDRSKIKSAIASLSAGGGGDFPELVVPALNHALDKGGFAQGAMNRIVLIGDAPPHEKSEDALLEVGKKAKARFTRIDALVCGNEDAVKSPFGLIATASKGQVFKLAGATDLTKKTVEEVKKRAEGIPIERYFGIAGEKGKTLSEIAQELKIGAGAARQMQQLLLERGVDVVKTEFREAWVRAVPGPKKRLQVLAYMSRQEMAKQLSAMLGANAEMARGKDTTENATTQVDNFLRNIGGEKANAGIRLKGEKAADRAKGLATSTSGVDRDAKGAILFRKDHEKKIRGLLTGYWRSPLKWRDGYAWVPTHLLP